jgi:glycosyltransferase involved in cell wall biosynthesis
MANSVFDQKHALTLASAHNPRIAVLVPCFNEEVSVPSVVRAFKEALPRATIYVYDNNSSDRTIEVARAAGAIVRTERLQGKGNVMRRMFSDIEADIYVLVDGDNTYEAAAAPRLVAYLMENALDMVTGARINQNTEAYRRGHKFGNWMLTTLVATIFGKQTTDMLSGYRVLSRRFVKSFPALSRGFEIETELTVHALELRMPIAEVETSYVARMDGSESKLSTYRDGFRILKMILNLVKEERPFQFFSVISMLLIVLALFFGVPVITEFVQTGEVPRLPSAVLAASIVIIAILAFFAGLILDSVALGRREMKRLHYLSLPPPGNQYSGLP